MALTDVLSSSDHQIASGGLWAVKRGYHQALLAGNQTLDQTFPMVCGFDPGGASRDVVLDGLAAAALDLAVAGLMRVIVNRADAAENLVVKDAAGNTIATVNQNETGHFYHDETVGWVLMYIVTSAIA